MSEAFKMIDKSDPGAPKIRRATWAANETKDDPETPKIYRATWAVNVVKDNCQSVSEQEQELLPARTRTDKNKRGKKKEEQRIWHNSTIRKEGKWRNLSARQRSALRASALQTIEENPGPIMVNDWHAVRVVQAGLVALIEQWPANVRLTATEAFALLEVQVAGHVIQVMGPLEILSALTGWIRDLTMDGIEPNPGPCMIAMCGDINCSKRVHLTRKRGVEKRPRPETQNGRNAAQRLADKESLCICRDADGLPSPLPCARCRGGHYHGNVAVDREAEPNLRMQKGRGATDAADSIESENWSTVGEIALRYREYLEDKGLHLEFELLPDMEDKLFCPRWCMHVAMTGTCPFGDGCKFSHITPLARLKTEIRRAQAATRVARPPPEESVAEERNFADRAVRSSQESNRERLAALHARVSKLGLGEAPDVHELYEPESEEDVPESRERASIEPQPCRDRSVIGKQLPTQPSQIRTAPKSWSLGDESVIGKRMPAQPFRNRRYPGSGSSGSDASPVRYAQRLSDLGKIVSRKEHRLEYFDGHDEEKEMEEEDRSSAQATSCGEESEYRQSAESEASVSIPFHTRRPRPGLEPASVSSSSADDSETVASETIKRLGKIARRMGPSTLDALCTQSVTAMKCVSEHVASTRGAFTRVAKPVGVAALSMAAAVLPGSGRKGYRKTLIFTKLPVGNSPPSWREQMRNKCLEWGVKLKCFSRTKRYQLGKPTALSALTSYEGIDAVNAFGYDFPLERTGNIHVLESMGFTHVQTVWIHEGLLAKAKEDEAYSTLRAFSGRGTSHGNASSTVIRVVANANKALKFVASEEDEVNIVAHLCNALWIKSYKYMVCDPVTSSVQSFRVDSHLWGAKVGIIAFIASILLSVMWSRASRLMESFLFYVVLSTFKKAISYFPTPW